MKTVYTIHENQVKECVIIEEKHSVNMSWFIGRLGDGTDLPIGKPNIFDTKESAEEVIKWGMI